jgi:uncharacterized protein involved in type VI secretion and phage assembly
VQTASVELASLDYRAVSLRPQSQSADSRFSSSADGASQALPDLSLHDIPGVYAFEDNAQGARLALRQMQALDAQREQVQAQGNLRTAAPGTTFSLLDHAEHDGTDGDRDRFVILSAQHRARSNLSADHQARATTATIARPPSTNAASKPNAQPCPCAWAVLMEQAFPMCACIPALPCKACKRLSSLASAVSLSTPTATSASRCSSTGSVVAMPATG